jgi:hypothetical protein
MTQNIIKGLVALGAVVVLALGGYALFHGSQSFGGAAYEALPKWFGNGLYAGSSQQLSINSNGAVTVGSSGTAVSGVNWKSCPLIASSFTVAASTTVPMDCAVAGAVSTDFVMAQFGTTTVPAATTGGWRIVGVSASSTSGYDTIQVRNDTGASAIIPAQIASSTEVLNIR